jgi:LuxR family maltose regulon positive regulatory protein
MYALLNAFSQQAQPSLLPYLQTLLMAFPTVDHASGLMPNLTDVLTDREIEILRLLAEGHSYRQVAQRALLAFSTVQSYIRVLYRKLGAHSGREAVARARALKLIT